MSIEEFAAAVGASPEEVFAETDRWARQNAERISKLADHLETLTPTAELSYDEVVALLS